jgi:hypothetical protein
MVTLNRVGVVAIVGIVLAGCTAGTPTASPTPTDAHACLARERVESVTTDTGGALRDALVNHMVADDVTYDLRGVTFIGQQDLESPGVSVKPLNLGDGTRPARLCVIGGLVQGTHSRDLDWMHFKDDPGGGDGPAYRLAGSGWTLLDGIRVDNMMDGVAPLSDGVVIRNAYFNYVRDDCISDDRLMRVTVEDSLFDGCYTAFSRRPDKGSPLYDEPRDTSLLELDRVLVRLQAMPGGHNQPASKKTYNGFWKWSNVTGPALIRDSILLAEETDARRSGLDWPSNVTAENVTLVWTGEGPYPGVLPAQGVEVTDDIAVWEEARSRWLERHGCRDITDCDGHRLMAPSPDTSPTGD